MNQATRQALAWHEARHAVAAWLFDAPIGEIQLPGAGECMTFRKPLQLDDVPECGRLASSDAVDVERYVATLMGGEPEDEGDDPTGCWVNDLETIERWADAVCPFDPEMSHYIYRLRCPVAETLDNYLFLVDAVADRLLTDGSMPASGIDALFMVETAQTT